MWTSLKNVLGAGKIEDVEFCQKSFLLTFSKNWMVNFEFLKNSLKKVDQQDLNHADQQGAPWAGENEDGETSAEPPPLCGLPKRGESFAQLSCARKTPTGNRAIESCQCRLGG
jgi:hypothetical protein